MGILNFRVDLPLFPSDENGRAEEFEYLAARLNAIINGPQDQIFPDGQRRDRDAPVDPKKWQLGMNNDYWLHRGEDLGISSPPGTVYRLSGRYDSKAELLLAYYVLEWRLREDQVSLVDESELERLARLGRQG